MSEHHRWSLESWNRKRRKQYRRLIDRDAQDPPAMVNFIGISCPECGEDMIDTEPGVMRTSYPPKAQVRCTQCGHYNYRVW